MIQVSNTSACTMHVNARELTVHFRSVRIRIIMSANSGIVKNLPNVEDWIIAGTFRDYCMATVTRKKVGFL
jgi:hypothetical protein